ncbi:MAG: DUF4468 domain-containing protein [Bacteroidetes bacterium]|nr:DUF4468 domain-containing protein [Bacteroidota bacterium]
MRTFKLYSAALLMFAAIPSFAQDASERNSEIGSKVLMQEGTDKVSWKNGKYTYEKILEVPGVDKKTLYERAKAWVKVNVKTSQDHIYFDDNEQNSILATTALKIKDSKNSVMTNQFVDFKFKIYFKEGKVKIACDDFVYHGISQAGEVLQKDFDNLKSMYKTFQKEIYTDFDEHFPQMITSLESSLKKSGNDDKW